LRGRVVDAEVYAPLTPASGLRPGLVGDRPRAFALSGRPRTVRFKQYGLPPSSFGVGACSVQVRSRGLEFARGGRCCSLRPLRPISYPWRIPCRFRGRRPAGLTLHVPRLSPRFADADPPRVVSPTALEEPRNQEEPTSGILCRLAGTDHRLQPTHRCPMCTRVLRHAAHGGFTCSASTASRPLRKD
jgi:hypothetical protein